MTYFAVIDTNVIVSSMLKSNSIPGWIIKLVSKNIIVPLLNEEIVNEYYEVLTRNEFGLNPLTVNTLLEGIKEKGLYLQRHQSFEQFIDKDDIVFYEIVMSARSTMDAYFVTGNLRHYPIRKYVVTPREMMQIIEKETGLQLLEA